MPTVLTRETMAAAVQAGVSGDANQPLTLDLSRGNVAVINQLMMFAEPESIGDTNTDGTLAISLDSGLGAPGNVTDLTTDTDDNDLENNEAQLLAVEYHFFFEVDATNGVGVAAHPGRQGLTADYRRLPLLQRPFTSENPELLINATGLAVNIQASLYVWYQVVRLDQGELERLVPSGLGPSARIVRFPAVPQDDPLRQPVVTLIG